MTVSDQPAPSLDETTSLAVLARRIAAELTAGALVCRRAEGLAAGLAEGGASLDCLAALQSLDELTQRLDNLAAVLEAVADRSPPDWTLAIAPLLAQVRLSDLACRLDGAPATAPVSGEADIF